MKETYQANVINNVPLTPREAEVLKYLCEGNTRSQIKDLIHRSYGSVSKQIESIAHKFNVNGSKAIIIHAVVHDIVSISLKSLLLLVTLSSAFSGAELRRAPRPPSVRLVRLRSEFI